MLCEGLLLCLRVGDGTRRYSLAVARGCSHERVAGVQEKERIREIGGEHTDAILFLSLRLGTYVVLMPIVY